ncbi:putative DNA primase/helicase [Oxalobacteraceae bacterium GrIS 1.11]
MIAAGMPALPANHPVLDGKYKRFGPGKKAWYILRIMTLRSGRDVVTGAFGYFQGQERNTVPVTIDFEEMSDADRVDLARKQKELAAKEAKDKQRAADLAANRARDQWDKAEKFAVVHPYLDKKKITPEGVRVSGDGFLLIPLRRDGKLIGLQKIDQACAKRYNKGASQVDAACVLGVLAGAEIIGVGEGYATCRTVRMLAPDPANAFPVVAAWDAGNIMAIALRLRVAFPDAHLLFLADDDYLLEPRFIAQLRDDFKVSAAVPIDGQSHTLLADDGESVQAMATWRTDAQGIAYIEADIRKGRMMRMPKYENAGVACCRAAAVAVGNASVVVPVFADRAGRKLSDFNDLAVEESFDIARAQIDFAILAAKQPRLVPPAPSAAPAAVPVLPVLPVEGAIAESPPPPGAEQPARRTSDGAEAEGISDPLLAATLEARYDEGAVVGSPDDAGDAFSEGAGGKGHKEKPKKVYGREHWDQVEYVLRNFVLVYGEDLVWDVSQRMLMKTSSMRMIVANNDVMKFWSGEARRWVLKKNIVFDPKDMPSPASSGATATVNLFSGWKMQPKRGACLKIQTLLAHLCDGNDELVAWVERWLAFPLRNRGAKMETSIIMHGDEGSGKNFFFEKVIKKIYGEYGYVIGNAQLESQFNDWASMKLFMVADEVVTRSELKHMKGKLKYLVSGDMIIINPKGLPEHGEANHMNFVFLSNELQPLALDKTDRRYLVIWTPPALSKEFYVEVATEIANGGIEAFYHYLMHDLDMGDFDEHTKPLYTDAKDDLIEKSLTPAERFYRDWSRGFLPLPFISCGATQLYDAYKVWCEKSGESRYISQTVFSPTVTRYAGDALEKKVIKYEYGNVVKQRNVFLAGKKPEGKTLSAWVEDASALFEASLKVYRSRSSINVEA